MTKILTMLGIVFFATSRKGQSLHEHNSQDTIKFSGIREKLEEVVQKKNKLNNDLKYLEDRITALENE